MQFATADLSDQYPDVAIAEPLFSDYGGLSMFSGQIHTLKLFEDNSLVRDTLAQDGLGRVLVVDGGGSVRCALLGGNLGVMAQDNGWAGIIINGCVRDSAELMELEIGVRALATHPRRSVKKGHGESAVTLHFADIDWPHQGWVYADDDGLIVSTSALNLAT